MNIEMKVVKKADLIELVNLYKGAGWWEEETDEVSFLGDLVTNSFCFVGAFHNGKMIGMGRSISDGVSDAYIQDVTVLPEYRNKGIGSKIINSIVSYLLEKDLKWIGLIGEPGTGSFYRSLGFAEMKDYIPMLLKQ